MDEKEYKGKYACVRFDLEYYGQNTLESLLERLAETIVNQLDIKSYQVEIPTAEQIKVQKDIFCNKFLPQIYAKLKDSKEQAYQIIEQLNHEKKSAGDIADSANHESGLETHNIEEYFKNINYNVYDFNKGKNVLPLKRTINQHKFPSRGLGNIKYLTDKIPLNKEEKRLIYIGCSVALIAVIFLAFSTSNGKKDQNNHINLPQYINSNP